MHVVATNIVRYILMDFPNAMIVAGYYYSGLWVLGSGFRLPYNYCRPLECDDGNDVGFLLTTFLFNVYFCS